MLPLLVLASLGAAPPLSHAEESYNRLWKEHSARRAIDRIFVIEHKGVIRHHQVGFDPRDDKITPLVRKLVKQAETE